MIGFLVFFWHASWWIASSRLQVGWVLSGSFFVSAGVAALSWCLSQAEFGCCLAAGFCWVLDSRFGLMCAAALLLDLTLGGLVISSPPREWNFQAAFTVSVSFPISSFICFALRYVVSQPSFVSPFLHCLTWHVGLRLHFFHVSPLFPSYGLLFVQSTHLWVVVSASFSLAHCRQPYASEQLVTIPGWRKGCGHIILVHCSFVVPLPYHFFMVKSAC